MQMMMHVLNEPSDCRPHIQFYFGSVAMTANDDPAYNELHSAMLPNQAGISEVP